DATRQWIDRSRVHWNEGNVEAALHCCRQALSNDPSNADALTNAGTLLAIKGDAEAAEKLYLEACSAIPDHIGAILGIAALRHAGGDMMASLAWVERAAAIR